MPVCGSGAVVSAWVSPDSQATACPPSGRDSTYRPVQISATGSEVLLEELDIDGFATAIDAVRINTATRVTIQNCSIRNFLGNGVNLGGPLGARIVIADSTILSNNIGLNIAGSGGAANVGILLRTIIDNHPVASVRVAAGSTVIMSGAKLLGSPIGVSLTSGSNFTSFGDNAIQSFGNPNNVIPLR